MTHTSTLSFFYGPVNSGASRAFQFVTVEIARSQQVLPAQWRRESLSASNRPVSH